MFNVVFSGFCKVKGNVPRLWTDNAAPFYIVFYLAPGQRTVITMATAIDLDTTYPY